MRMPATYEEFGTFPSSTCWYDRVYVSTYEQWEMLRDLPTSISGVWRPEKHEGWARFSTPTAARAARRWI